LYEASTVIFSFLFEKKNSKAGSRLIAFNDNSTEISAGKNLSPTKHKTFKKVLFLDEG
jgi:hypothetical protein